MERMCISCTVNVHIKRKRTESDILIVQRTVIFFIFLLEIEVVNDINAALGKHRIRNG